MRSSDPTDEGPGPVGYLALVLAWAVPGLGHIVLGQRARGIIFALTIHLLFAFGLLIGGIRSINPQDQPIWTYTQFLTGWPMTLANYLESGTRAEFATPPPPDFNPMTNPWPQFYNTQSEYWNSEGGRPDPNDTKPASIARRMKQGQDYIADHPIFAYHPKVQDIGAVYCGIAGMLNLLVMFDVLLRITGSVREDPEAIRRKRPAAPKSIASSAPAPAASGGATP